MVRMSVCGGGSGSPVSCAVLPPTTGATGLPLGLTLQGERSLGQHAVPARDRVKIGELDFRHLGDFVALGDHDLLEYPRAQQAERVVFFRGDGWLVALEAGPVELGQIERLDGALAGDLNVHRDRVADRHLKRRGLGLHRVPANRAVEAGRLVRGRQRLDRDGLRLGLKVDGHLLVAVEETLERFVERAAPVLFLADAQHHALFHWAKLEFPRLDRRGGGAECEHLIDLVALLHPRLLVLGEGGDVEAVGDEFRHLHVHAVDEKKLDLDRDNLPDVGGCLGGEQPDVGVLRLAVVRLGFLPGGQHEKL